MYLYNQESGVFLQVGAVWCPADRPTDPLSPGSPAGEQHLLVVGPASLQEHWALLLLHSFLEAGPLGGVVSRARQPGKGRGEEL